MTMRQLNKYAEIAMVSHFLGFMIDAYDMAPVLGVYFHRFSVFDHDGCATNRVSLSTLVPRLCTEHGGIPRSAGRFE